MSAPLGVSSSTRCKRTAPLRNSSQTLPANQVWGMAKPSPACSLHLLCTGPARAGSISAQ
eukprot:11207986-Lingulodinium_polyedra.AAC.1